MDKVFIGIDNGVTGSIGIIDDKGQSFFVPVPVKSEQNYTKTKANITRVDFKQLTDLWKSYEKKASKLFFMIERPMVNPSRFKATTSALRCLEAVLISIELLNAPYSIMYIDSKEWQKALLPFESKGEQLKKDSMGIGSRLFAEHKTFINKQKDADGILIAEYCRRFFK
jgi:hypothetical protein